MRGGGQWRNDRQDGGQVLVELTQESADCPAGGQVEVGAVAE